MKNISVKEIVELIEFESKTKLTNAEIGVLHRAIDRINNHIADIRHENQRVVSFLGGVASGLIHHLEEDVFGRWKQQFFEWNDDTRQYDKFTQNGLLAEPQARAMLEHFNEAIESLKKNIEHLEYSYLKEFPEMYSTDVNNFWESGRCDFMSCLFGDNDKE